MNAEAINQFISEYVESFEARDPDYQPNEPEKDLIREAIHGLMADEEFLALIRKRRPQGVQQVVITMDEDDEGVVTTEMQFFPDVTDDTNSAAVGMAVEILKLMKQHSDGPIEPV